MRIWILLSTLMRINIQCSKIMRIRIRNTACKHTAILVSTNTVLPWYLAANPWSETIITVLRIRIRMFFGPTGSGSGSNSMRYRSGYGYGSGSFYHQDKIVRKTGFLLFWTSLWLFLSFLYFISPKRRTYILWLFILEKWCKWSFKQ
jgi:hypothetical protein